MKLYFVFGFVLFFFFFFFFLSFSHFLVGFGAIDGPTPCIANGLPVLLHCIFPRILSIFSCFVFVFFLVAIVDLMVRDDLALFDSFFFIATSLILKTFKNCGLRRLD